MTMVQRKSHQLIAHLFSKKMRKSLRIKVIYSNWPTDEREIGIDHHIQKQYEKILEEKTVHFLFLGKELKAKVQEIKDWIIAKHI